MGACRRLSLGELGQPKVVFLSHELEWIPFICNLIGLIIAKFGTIHWKLMEKFVSHELDALCCGTILISTVIQGVKVGFEILCKVSEQSQLFAGN